MTSNTFCRRHIDVLTGVTMWVAGLEIKAKKLRSITKQIDLGIRIKKLITERNEARHCSYYCCIPTWYLCFVVIPVLFAVFVIVFVVYTVITDGSDNADNKYHDSLDDDK